MNSNVTLIKCLAAVGLLVASAAPQAALVVYNTQASFLAAVSSPGVDTFAGLSITDATASPMLRSAGSYSYTAASTTSFFGAGSVANPWLSTNAATDTITFSGFSPGMNAVGGLFFGSDVSGAFANGTVVLTAIDSLGATLTQTITGATLFSFLGFQSTGTITSLALSSVSPNSTVWPTVDNLTLAIGAVTAVPEPETWALMLGGLGVLGTLARRRRR
jgi:PEP-CTERM motif